MNRKWLKLMLALIMVVSLFTTEVSGFITPMVTVAYAETDGATVAQPTPSEPEAQPTPSEPEAQPTPSEPEAQPTPSEPEAQPTPSEPEAQPTPSEPEAQPTPSEPEAQPTPSEPGEQPAIKIQLDESMFNLVYSSELTYDGNVHGASVTSNSVDASAYSALITYNNNSSEPAYAGEYSIKCVITANENSDYEGTVTLNGTMVINRKESVEIIITGDSKEVAYNGSQHSLPVGYSYGKIDPSIEIMFKGDKDDVAGTNVGTYKMNLEGKLTASSRNYESINLIVVDGYLKITPINVTVTITGHNNTTDYDGEEHTVTGYDVKISNPLYTEADFTFSGSAEAKRTDAGTTNMNLAAGQFANTNANFATVTFNVTDGYQTITPIDVTVTIVGANNTADYDGEEHSVSGYTATASTDLYDVENDFTFSGTAEAARTDAGTTNMGLAAEQFANTNTNFATVTFNVTDGYQTINPIDVTVTIVGNNNTNDYDGQPHTVTSYTATASTTLYDVTKDFTFSGTAEAKRTDAGTTNMGLAADQFANTNQNFANVTFQVTDGYQTINPIDVTVTIVGNNNTTDYDGEEHSVSGYTATASTTLYDVTKDFTFSGTAEAARTDAGTTNMGLVADQFANTNPNFANVTFQVTDGYQTINPIDVTVTIVGNNNTTDYDGEEHSVSGYTATASTTLYDVTKDFTFSGTAEAARTDAGTTNMGLVADQFENTNDNFKTVTFNVTDGYQTIEKINAVVTIVGKNNTTVYDGKEHSVSGYTATASTKLYDAENDFEFIGTAAAARTDVGTTNMALAAEQFKNTNKNFATVTFDVTDGYQTITPIDEVTVIITENSGSFMYDGNKKSVEGYTVQISNPLYKETDFTFNGEAIVTETYSGTYDMKLVSEDFVNNNENFSKVTFKIEDGKLEITKSTKELKVVANSNSWEYDSEYHADGGYTVTYGDETYTVEAGKSATLSTGDTVTATITAQVKNVADTKEGNNEIVTLVIENEDQYANVVTKAGTLTITQRPVTITAASDSKEYDGTALTNAEYKAEGLAEGDATKSVKVEGSITFADTKAEDKTGVEKNVASDAIIMDGEEDVTANYDIKYVDGELRITQSTKELKVVANSEEWTYDGKEHCNGGYTVTYNGKTYEVAAGESATLTTGDKVTATIETVVKNVVDTAEGNNEIVTLVIENAEQYANVETEAGTLTINKYKLTKDNVEYNDTLIYNAKAQVPTVVLKFEGEGGVEAIVTLPEASILPNVDEKNNGIYKFTVNGNVNEDGEENFEGCLEFEYSIVWADKPEAPIDFKGEKLKDNNWFYNVQVQIVPPEGYKISEGYENAEDFHSFLTYDDTQVKREFPKVVYLQDEQGYITNAIEIVKYDQDTIAPTDETIYMSNMSTYIRITAKDATSGTIIELYRNGDLIKRVESEGELLNSEVKLEYEAVIAGLYEVRLYDKAGNVAIEQGDVKMYYSDADGDRLTDAYEQSHNSDPYSTDTDNDGLDDYNEMLNNTNPSNPDSDGDGLDDNEEISVYMTSPTKADTDEDGINDFISAAMSKFYKGDKNAATALNAALNNKLGKAAPYADAQTMADALGMLEEYYYGEAIEFEAYDAPVRTVLSRGNNRVQLMRGLDNIITAYDKDNGYMYGVNVPNNLLIKFEVQRDGKLNAAGALDLKELFGVEEISGVSVVADDNARIIALANWDYEADVALSNLVVFIPEMDVAFMIYDTAGCNRFEVSPDGSKIAYALDGDAFMIDLITCEMFENKCSMLAFDNEGNLVVEMNGNKATIMKLSDEPNEAPTLEKKVFEGVYNTKQPTLEGKSLELVVGDASTELLEAGEKLAVEINGIATTHSMMQAMAYKTADSNNAVGYPNFFAD